MGELAILLLLGVAVASFVVVPFLGWGLSDPGGQWQQIRSWRGGDADTVLVASRLEWHRAVNGVALALWLALLIWLITSVA